MLVVHDIVTTQGPCLDKIDSLGMVVNRAQLIGEKTDESEK